jgi:hypothetical protein
MAEADNKYDNGKIYELVYKDKRYIGSTTMTLKDRYSRHKSDWVKGESKCTSRVLFEIAKVDGGTVVINLVEDYPCVSRKELEVRERFHMEQCQDRVNERIPGRSLAEIAEYLAEYYEANKDKIAERKAIKVKCECGVTHRRYDKALHDKSKRHIDYLRD